MLQTVLDFFGANIFGNILFGYFFGSIPFGLLLCAAFGYGDIRKIGSGNIGATNVLRTGNKILALITLILDSGKGVSAFILMYAFIKLTGDASGLPISDALPSCAAVSCMVGEPCPCTNDPIVADPNSAIALTATIAAFSAVLGHMFPVWLKFQGGKGVATAFGAMLAATPITAAVALLVWIMSVLATKTSSLAALSASLIAPVVTWIFYGDMVGAITAVICTLVWIRHKDNILRLIKGKEPKIGDKKKSK